MDPEAKCKSCKFWEEKTVEPPAMGLCRRYAPRPLAVSALSSAENLDAVWPRTGPDAWCGEWDRQV
jgi:hypothetical protein